MTDRERIEADMRQIRATNDYLADQAAVWKAPLRRANFHVIGVAHVATMSPREEWEALPLAPVVQLRKALPIGNRPAKRSVARGRRKASPSFVAPMGDAS